MRGGVEGASEVEYPVIAIVGVMPLSLCAPIIVCPYHCAPLSLCAPIIVCPYHCVPLSLCAPIIVRPYHCVPLSLCAPIIVRLNHRWLHVLLKSCSCKSVHLHHVLCTPKGYTWQHVQLQPRTPSPCTGADPGKGAALCVQMLGCTVRADARMHCACRC